MYAGGGSCSESARAPRLVYMDMFTAVRNGLWLEFFFASVIVTHTQSDDDAADTHDRRTQTCHGSDRDNVLIRPGGRNGKKRQIHCQ